MNTAQWTLAAGAIQAALALLLWLGWDAKLLREKVGTITPRSKIMGLLIFGSFLFSGLGFYEARDSPATPLSDGISFAGWGTTEDRHGCTALLDVSKMPRGLRDEFEVAVACGFVDPTIDRLKDSRITISRLFTPVNAITISMAFSKAMADGLKADQELALEKVPVPPRGSTTNVQLTNLIWMIPVLLPKGFDTSQIRTLRDIQTHGGKIGAAQVEVSMLTAVTRSSE